MPQFYLWFRARKIAGLEHFSAFLQKKFRPATSAIMLRLNPSLTKYGTLKVEETRAGRYKVIGNFQGRTIVAVVFRPLGSEAFSVISMRQASKAERKAL